MHPDRSHFCRHDLEPKGCIKLWQWFQTIADCEEALKLRGSLGNLKPPSRFGWRCDPYLQLGKYAGNLLYLLRIAFSQ